MAAMGMGRIRHLARESGNASGESVTFSGRKMVRPVGRRLFMQASGLAVVSVVGACGNDSNGGDNGNYGYVLEALAVAAADIVGVYLVGIPVGTMIVGAVKVVDAADSGDPMPDRVNVNYQSQSAQGNGTVSQYDFSGMPRSSDNKGNASMDTQGLGWVQAQNTVGEDIEYVKLLRAQGQEVLPTNKGTSGFLSTNWGHGDDLFLTGLPDYDPNNPYTQLLVQTASGKQTNISLV